MQPLVPLPVHGVRWQGRRGRTSVHHDEQQMRARIRPARSAWWSMGHDAVIPIFRGASAAATAGDPVETGIHSPTLVVGQRCCQSFKRDPFT
ncbi:hypothetical protein CSOJ01_08040 [Colletotrichum sojae]|uniref:Uncharacterized protein n=1 Tax=Colletotrichum sojae TaxID=2175907 RepID=A0A8H6MTK4_9PEZI|nr:hypothetical protein CSOJ01_08040 [Colletotrichum sojae]